jgi:hypothetical protein
MARRTSALEAIFGDDFPVLQMIRVGPSEKLTGFVTSHQVHCYLTHWSGGRTVGHVFGCCPGCNAGIVCDFNAYVGFFCPSTRHHRLLNLTKAAVGQIRDGAGTLWNLRGLQLTLKRRGGKINNRLMVDTGMIYPGHSGLPDPVHATDHLMRIWGPEYAATVCKLNGIDWTALDPFPKAYFQLFHGSDDDIRALVHKASDGSLEGQTYLPGEAQ